MIKSRKDEFSITGSGKNILALDSRHLELIGAIVGMIKLGHSPHQQAAYELITYLEEVTGDCDFILTALTKVMPVLQVHDCDTYDVIATYDEDYILEFIV